MTDDDEALTGGALTGGAAAAAGAVAGGGPAVIRPPVRERYGVVGYLPGVFDMFHIGHLNILRRARLECDYLIAGVVSDEVALQQKGKYPVIPQDERIEIVANIGYADDAVMEWTTDKLVTWDRVRFDVIFKGDDWKGSEKWTNLAIEFAKVGVTVAYLPYTARTSTTKLRGLIGMGG